MRLLTLAAAVTAFASLAGCRREPGDAPLTHTVKIDVGGAVVYAGNPDERLSGVTVTLTDLDGDIRIAITGSAGLWTIENVRPGVYTESYEAPGYEPMTSSFGLDAFGEDDVKNRFVARPDVALEETKLVATVSGPFSAVLHDGDAPLDGFLGATFTYSESAPQDIVVTFSRALLLPTGDGDVRARQPGGNTVEANRSDTASATVFTLPAAELNSELGSDSDGLTFMQLEIDVPGLTPIHQDIETFGALLRYNATP